MSTETYARAMVRESKIWSPFMYSFPFDAPQMENRIIVYGLYSGAYLNQHEYLREIETVDLANIVNDYNTKLASLTIQEQIVISDIVSKRYLAGIDKLIHDQQMVTKSNKIDAENEAWDAKMAALAADEAALETLILKVASETKKTAARIAELEAYITIEGYNLSAVDIEIAEKELQSAKVDLAKLDALNDVLKIQVDTVITATQMIGVDLQIAQTKTDIAHTTRSIAQIELLVNDLVIAQAQTTVETAELAVETARLDLTGKKIDEVDKEQNYYDALIDQAIIEYNSRMSLSVEKQSLRMSEIDQRKVERLLNFELQTDESNLGPVLAQDNAVTQEQIDGHTEAEYRQKVLDRSTLRNGVLRVAEFLATAKITTSLEHVIKKANE